MWKGKKYVMGIMTERVSNLTLQPLKMFSCKTYGQCNVIMK